MNQGKFVFSQLTDFLPKRIFDGLVTKYNANKYVRHFYMLESVTLHGIWTTYWKR
jgi:hypothetical protein